MRETSLKTTSTMNNHTVILTKNQTMIPANIAIVIVTTEIGHDFKTEPLVAFVKMVLSCFFRVITTTPGTRTTGINLL